ncbi:MAG: hypothetical protein IPO21_18115 [Bacteroidales bacterium]|nr:hypothetical protein [Bacteroidales bacterium]
MATITDFKEWIKGSDLENYNDVYCLYKSVEELNEWGAFSTSKRQTSKGNMYFVKCVYLDEVLMLASDKVRDYFMEYLEKQYAGEMGMEDWYYFKYAMEKND